MLGASSSPPLVGEGRPTGPANTGGTQGFLGPPSQHYRWAWRRPRLLQALWRLAGAGVSWGAFGLVETGTDWQQGMSGEPCTDSRSQHGIACGHVELSSSKTTYSQLRDRQILHKHAAKLRWRPQQRRWERRRRTGDAGSGGGKDGSSKAVWAGATTMAAALTAAPAATAAASTSIRRVRSAAAERGSVRCAPPAWRFELLQLMHPRHHARSTFETPAASP